MGVSKVKGSAGLGLLDVTGGALCDLELSADDLFEQWFEIVLKGLLT